MDCAPLWYKDAIIYELNVRTFFDSNGDGFGDFNGLTKKLDYLQRLGVTCLWLLPFYPSPLRDGGYDIAHYEHVHPDCGTLEDFKRFLQAAHDRGLRVITELVINHTSDQHPWFDAARRAPAGSAKRDFYVWSDTTERYADARVIFHDAESSNWTWDPVAGAYYWHRFFHHQPDLNFDNPHVKLAVLKVMRFWLDMGVDGLRLDAIAHLFERDGTSCDNLPETHAFLKEIRADINHRYADRVLLAEANQPPAVLRPYFGEGDECHMAFHFPLMPRLFLALAQEMAAPIRDILEQTTDLPDACQWAVFLRNHDELTLSAVTGAEREQMLAAYAPEPRMRLNHGIRRRLAPLLRHDEARIELAHALLLSMPGTPVLYYGDEIAMDEDLTLPDRDGVRTPMRWDLVQGAEGHSLHARIARLIQERQASRVFGRGSIEFPACDNPRVLAFVRRYEQQAMVVVANLSRDAQVVSVDFRGKTEGLVPSVLTLPPSGWIWLPLTESSETDRDRLQTRQLPGSASL